MTKPMPVPKEGWSLDRPASFQVKPSESCLRQVGEMNAWLQIERKRFFAVFPPISEEEIRKTIQDHSSAAGAYSAYCAPGRKAEFAPASEDFEAFFASLFSQAGVVAPPDGLIFEKNGI